MVDFKEGAKLFRELAEKYQFITRKKPKRFIPKGPGWTSIKRLKYAEARLEEHWEQMKLLSEICQNLAYICVGLDRLQSQIQDSVLAKT